MNKKIVFLIISSFLFFNVCFGEYKPTSKDEFLLSKVYQKLDIIIQDNHIKAQKIMDTSQTIYTSYKHVDRIEYIFKSIYSYILKRKTRTDDIPKDNEILSKNYFLQKHWTGIVNDLPQLCFDKYDIIDKIAKEENIPTTLVITAWKTEHNCLFDNPPNWHWIFQIYSKTYETGNIDEEMFKQQIKDYISISKWKINHYNKVKTYWDWNINISYEKFDIDSLRIFAFLYNWAKKNKNPWNSEYVNWNIKPEFKYKKDWFILTFIKVLKREIEYKNKNYQTDNYRL